MLDRYVNDRPYAASSFLSVAIADVFGSALAGQSKERPELANQPIPLRAALPALPVSRWRGVSSQAVRAARLPGGAPRACRSTKPFPAWGESAYHRVELEATLPLHQLLSHLYVLVPVLDNDKHYWVGDDEVEKLLRHGEGWLASHPERDAITRRYLKHQRSLVTDALAQLVDESDPNPDETAETQAQEEATSRARMKPQRTASGHRARRAQGQRGAIRSRPGLRRGHACCGCCSRSVSSSRIVGLDVSHRVLEMARGQPALRHACRRRKRSGLSCFHGSLMYRDERLAGFRCRGGRGGH